jgi:hypothetical protein
VVGVNAAEALWRVGAYGLPGANSESIVVDSFDELVDIAESQRMLPWLSAMVEDGRIDRVTEEDRIELRKQTLAAIQSTLAAHSAAASVISRLREAGVTDVRVLKGCATAYLDYAPLGRRFSSDVDLLVRLDDYDTVLSVFPSSDIPPRRSARFQGRYGKATTVVDESGVEIDIHTMLTHGYFGLAFSAAELMTSPEDFEIGGVEMQALDQPNRLLHAATHVGASEYFGMHSARDVLQLVLVGGADWILTVQRATAWGIDGLFAVGVLKAWELFAVDSHPIVYWAAAHCPTGRQQLALRIAVNRKHGPQMTGPLALPLHRWPGYILPFVFPSHEFLAARGERWTELVRRFAREVRP